MENYIHKNLYVLPDAQNTAKATKVPEPTKTSKAKIKVEVDLVLPKKLVEAIEAMVLSNIMTNKCLKLVDIISHKAMTEHRTLSAFVPLSKNYFNKTFNHDYYNDFLKALKHRKIIECDERYEPGTSKRKGECKSYRINPELLAGEFVIVTYKEKRKDSINASWNHLPQRDDSNTDSNNDKEIEDSNSYSSPVPIPISGRFFKGGDGKGLFGSRIYEEMVIKDLCVLSYQPERIMAIAKQHAAGMGADLLVDEDVLTWSFEVVNNITGTEYFTTREKALDLCRSRQLSLIQDKRKFYIDDLDSLINEKQMGFLDCCKWQTAMLENRMFYADRNETNNRLDHNLTGISRHVLKTIKEDNDLVEIDLKNSQFAIHAFWMKREGLYELYQDVRKYYQFCASGMLYDEIGKRLNLDRKDAKDLMMALAFASFKYHSPQKEWLKEMFPNVVNHIDGFKRTNGSEAFAVELQKQESNIFIDNLYRSIKELGIFCLPKHDSFLVKRQDAGVVIDLLQAFFQSIGFECALDIEGKKYVVHGK
ncbi:hypothetical protein [Polluticoccus soli]|uniref:hypothetical protein n=1 Tax=Polluticoccus soli TaxID=3034150 RepID=UPI0023E2DAB4|nr:hypothetical protein [Flavipsychrobacter sp. JY13-12]